MTKVKSGHVVNPFGVGIIIPKLPKKSADQATYQQRKNGFPVPVA